MRLVVPGIFAALLLAPMAEAGQPEDITFVSEHLPEIAMDNRYAQMPVWAHCAGERENCGSFTAGYAFTHSQTLSIDGPLLAAGLTSHRGAWSFTGFLFYDPLGLSSGHEQRPLDVNFTHGVPYTLPVAAEFSGLNGSADDKGIGFAVRHDTNVRWLGNASWMAGVMWQEMSLRNYTYDYRVLEGPDAGSSGQVSYDADYRHVVPFGGLAWPHRGERWAYMPHFQVAIPRPRRGMEGRITGPGFDLSGNQADFGARPFGDPSVTIGFDVTYLPWNLTVDLGSTVTQYLVEPHVHEGVDHDVLLTIRWDGRTRN